MPPHLIVGGRLTRRLSGIASYAYSEGVVTKDPLYGRRPKRRAFRSRWTGFSLAGSARVKSRCVSIDKLLVERREGAGMPAPEARISCRRGCKQVK